MNSYSFLRSRLGLAAIAAALLLVVLLSPHGYSLTNQYLANDGQTPSSIVSHSDKAYIDSHSNPNIPHHPLEDALAINAPAVAVVSMLYGDNDYYIRAINTHLRHAERFGYPSYVLRREIIDGVWNKLAYMMHVMISEMEKGEQGAKWLMWFDADSAVVNPALPHDIFLPPGDFDDIHVLASRDVSGFNAGMFFIRCHSWSVKLIANALTFPKYKPEVGLDFAEQSTLWHGMNETDNRPHVLWQPRTWYNAYQWHEGYEGDVGTMFVHFPGLQGDRWAHMGRWLEILEGHEAKNWEVGLKDTKYPKQIDEFWHAMRIGRQTLQIINENVQDRYNAPDSVRLAIESLEYIMGAETDRIDVVMKAVKDVKDAIDMYKGLQVDRTADEIKKKEEDEKRIKDETNAEFRKYGSAYDKEEAERKAEESGLPETSGDIVDEPKVPSVFER